MPNYGLQEFTIQEATNVNCFVEYNYEQFDVSGDTVDSDGKVVQKAEAKQEREFIALVSKSWNSSTGEANDDHKKEYNLSDLERDKAHLDGDIARLKEQSDGLALAIVDFKKQ